MTDKILPNFDRVANDSGLTLEKVNERLEGGVRIAWGELSVIVESHMIDDARAVWSAVRSIFNQEQLAQERDSIIADIEAALPETNKKRPRKSVMDKLMADLVAWHVMADYKN